MSDTDFLATAAGAVEAALGAGADAAEAYLTSGTSIEIEVRDGRVETTKSAAEKGLGLRVFRGRRFGYAYTTDLSPGGLKEMARRAVACAALTAEDEFHRLPDPVPAYPEVDIFDPRLPEKKIDEKIELARRMEEVARAYDPRVTIVESATYQDGLVEVGIVSSANVSAYYRGSACGLYIALTAREGEDHQTGFALDFKPRFADLNPEEVGREAAQRAVRMLGARSQAGMQVPVVFDPYVMVSLLGVLAPALTAEAVQKGRSLLAGRVGEAVASEHVTIVDDGTLEGGVRSAPFDGEGVPSSRSVLIEKGLLQGYLYNTYTAAKDGVSSTGNGVRSSYKGVPEVGTTNFFLAPGEKSPEELIGEIDTGFYVGEVMGMHTANPISGDFSVGATGLWIENGRLVRPVRGLAIAGNIGELLKAVDAVGKDLRFFGGKGAPTVRISRLSVSG
ncbi:TldD/PmbA family protein [Candidatus Desulforudis audaxviator]|uniref:Peptidase U62, modulator of DNA gyrase n=1 Tax=Desulforudis audaxviator (strain MP104C) TaxID=477974 RepID=B1I3B7_DESAP|nr:TldD/PmbA family protein [Candidatus Desulforudis audaxviator]ACA59514.1 peptidase U62, modulator of DNA gyrase [Candidatus Desulforudis audaxviator MP104C]AZK59497.1 TldE protein, part of TldE/TldD proteolytic complex [Candidatus Desulforudis audaxviator]